ncbi:MAG: hypothetical protein HC904_17050 [Blastochloris sp.]|nr:hypothetical protein [Blastochloris sp.]
MKLKRIVGIGMPVHKMKIAIVNAYDARNLGDQAIVHCQLSWLTHFFGDDAEFENFSHHWQENKTVFGDASAEPLILNDPNAGGMGRFFKVILDWFLAISELGPKHAGPGNFHYVSCAVEGIFTHPARASQAATSF